MVRSYDETPLAGASIPRLSAPESAQGRGPGVRLAAMTKTPIILQLAGAAVVGFATVALLNSCGGAPAEPLPPRDKSAIAAFEEENAIPTSDWYPRVQGFESSGGSRILFVHTDLYPDGDAKPIASQICGGYAGMTWERGARFTSVRVLDKADLVLVKCGYQP